MNSELLNTIVEEDSTVGEGGNKMVVDSFVEEVSQMRPDLLRESGWRWVMLFLSGFFVFGSSFCYG